MSMKRRTTLLLTLTNSGLGRRAPPLQPVTVKWTEVDWAESHELSGLHMPDNQSRARNTVTVRLSLRPTGAVQRLQEGQELTDTKGHMKQDLKRCIIYSIICWN